eukprot:7971822-Pyramimonas_sp.AAC.1
MVVVLMRLLLMLLLLLLMVIAMMAMALMLVTTTREAKEVQCRSEGRGERTRRVGGDTMGRERSEDIRGTPLRRARSTWGRRTRRRRWSRRR